MKLAKGDKKQGEREYRRIMECKKEAIESKVLTPQEQMGELIKTMKARDCYGNISRYKQEMMALQ